jgi:glutaredoxin
VEYINVLKDRDALDEMLRITNRRREVPVIVVGSNVTIGHGGT